MPEHPTIGIVVPVRDGERYLEETLRSLQAQTMSQWQCVIVDDGSTDGTVAVAQRMIETDPRISLVRQRNLGTPAARNAGIAALDARIPFLSFVDADDTLEPDALSQLLTALQDAPDAVGTYGYAEYMTSNGEPYARGVHPARQTDRRRLGRLDLTALPTDAPYTWSAWIVSGTLWPSAVALHRREVVERVGGFDTELRQVQDWDLYLRMSRLGPFLPIGQHVAWYRQHAANVTSRTERVAFYSLLVRRRAATSARNSPAQRREARRVLRRLGTRWVLSCLQSAGAASGKRDRAGLRAALGAAATFAPIAVSGRLPEPTPQLAGQLARFVMARHPMTRVLTEMPDHR